MIKKYLPAIAVLITLNGVAQTYPLNRFKDTVPPNEWSDRWYKLNNSPRAFMVSLPGGQLSVSNDTLRSNTTTFALKDGELLGVDYGEWGGGIYYAPADTTRKTFFINGRPGPTINDPFRGGLMIPKSNPLNERLRGRFLVARGNVKFIFPYNDSLFFMTGLAHMGLNYGALYRLGIQKDSFTVSKSIDFNDAPMAMTVYNNTIYIATYQGFYIVNKQGKEQIITKLFRGGLYPGSIAIADEHHIYVGMRGGYSVIDLPARQLKFFQYEP